MRSENGKIFPTIEKKLCLDRDTIPGPLDIPQAVKLERKDRHIVNIKV